MPQCQVFLCSNSVTCSKYCLRTFDEYIEHGCRMACMCFQGILVLSYDNEWCLLIIRALFFEPVYFVNLTRECVPCISGRRFRVELRENDNYIQFSQQSQNSIPIENSTCSRSQVLLQSCLGVMFIIVQCLLLFITSMLLKKLWLISS